MSHIAVIDIGKTNAKLALVNSVGLHEITVITQPNRVVDSPPWPHFDLAGMGFHPKRIGPISKTIRHRCDQCYNPRGLNCAHRTKW